jgi:hypothetical protein
VKCLNQPIFKIVATLKNGSQSVELAREVMALITRIHLFDGISSPRQIRIHSREFATRMRENH